MIRKTASRWFLYGRILIMNEPSRSSRWTRYIVYRAERRRTTWKFRLGALAVAATLLRATSACWTAAIGHSLVCDASLAPSDAILVENFEPNYLLYERARILREAGLAPRVLVPIFADPATAEPRDVAVGIAEVMARIARLDAVEIVAVQEAEPITLHAARDLERILHRNGIRSVIVVTPLLRSRRSALVYEVTLERSGITVRCDPVQGSRGAETWTDSWHGIQDVAEQWLKLCYYRLYVLPILAASDRASLAAPT